MARLTGFGSAGRVVLTRPRSAARAVVFLDLGDLARHSHRARPRRRGFAGDGGGGLGFGLAETAARGLFGARTGVLLGLVAGVFLGLAAGGFVLLAGEALGLGGTTGGGIDGRLALLGLVNLGVGQRAGAGIDLVGRQLAEHQAGARRWCGGGGRLRRRRRLGSRRGARGRLGLDRLRSRRRLGLLLAGQDDAALLALDLHRVGAAVREALADGIALDTPLQAKRALGRADRLFVCRFAHAFLGSCRQGSGFIKGVDWPAAGALRRPVTTETVEVANPRQQIFARRPGEQCSMYHICPAKCQIQILSRKAPDHRRFCLAETAAGGLVELGEAIRRGLGGMDQADDGIAGKRRFDLAEAADDGAGLAGERQGASRGGGKQAVDTLRQARLDHGAALEGAGEAASSARRGRHGRHRR